MESGRVKFTLYHFLANGKTGRNLASELLICTIGIMSTSRGCFPGWDEITWYKTEHVITLPSAS